MDFYKSSTNWRFCLVTVLKFSLFSTCKSVHRVVKFYAYNGFFFLNFDFLLFSDDFTKEIDNWPTKYKKIYMFLLTIESFNSKVYNNLNQKFTSKQKIRLETATYTYQFAVIYYQFFKKKIYCNNSASDYWLFVEMIPFLSKIQFSSLILFKLD